MKALVGLLLSICFGGLVVLGGGLSTALAASIETYGIVGDAGLWTPLTKVQRDSLLNDKVMKLVLLGDLLYNPKSSYNDVWSPWITKGFEFPVVALGNHHSTYAEEISFFKMPSEYYSYSTGVSRFIVMNSDNEKTINEQVRWFEKEINQAKEEFIFLVYHHPPYTITDHHGWQDKKNFQLQMRPLLQKYRNRLTALMVGHDHIAALYMLNTLPMIVSGASFENFPAQLRDYQEGDVRVKGEWTYKSNPHWARLDVIPDTHEVWLSFVDAKNRTVGCSVRLAPGPILKRPNCSQ